MKKKIYTEEGYDYQSEAEMNEHIQEMKGQGWILKESYENPSIDGYTAFFMYDHLSNKATQKKFRAMRDESRGIVTVFAENLEQAREKIIESLSQDGRTDLLKIWQENGEKIQVSIWENKED